MTKTARIAGLFALLTNLWITPLIASEINVVASIKPIHALVSGVMSGVGTPYLIVKGAASPHGYALKPSDARALENANVVFWVGEDLERFLEHSIQSLAKKATAVELIDTPGLSKLEIREGGLFGGHEHGHDTHGHDKHEGHGHASTDMHFWLDPHNAKAMVNHIASVLRQADPDNGASYSANAQKLARKLDLLDKELAGMMKPFKNARFIVFHDSYYYFEKRYGLTASGSITVSPEVPPGARRVQDIRKKIAASGAACIFAEPQFNPRVVETLADGLDAKQGILDPLGASLDEGPELYFTLLRNLASAFKRCFGA